MGSSIRLEMIVETFGQLDIAFHNTGAELPPTLTVAHMLVRERIAIKDMVDAQPIGQLGRLGAIADAVLWLCNPRNSLVIGHALVIDGNYSVP